MSLGLLSYEFSPYLLFDKNFSIVFEPQTLSFTRFSNENKYLKKLPLNCIQIQKHNFVSGLWSVKIPEKNIFNLKKVCYHLFVKFPKSPNNKNRQMSDVIELGVSLLSLENIKPKYVFHSSSNFGDVGEIYKFISWVMGKIAVQSPKVNNPEMDEIMDNIQITIRRYRKGQGIGPHVDRTDKFTDRIFTVVVYSVPNKGIIFCDQYGQEYEIPEVDGLLEIQTGDSRYKFTHKLNQLKYGNRISITWRFFRQDFLSQWRPANSSKEPVIEKLQEKINYYQDFSFFKNNRSYF